MQISIEIAAAFALFSFSFMTFVALLGAMACAIVQDAIAARGRKKRAMVRRNMMGG